MKKRILLSTTLSLLVVASPITYASGNGTWKLENNKWYYKVDNHNKIGWVLDKNKWYFLDASGIMKTGWVLDKNKWYFLDSSGAMKTGWVLDKNKWYFLDASGAMKTGWVLDKNKWYFLDASGAMKTGWVLDKNKWYFLDSSGAMKTGWITDNNNKYYLKENGSMVTGTNTIDGVTLTFSSSGALLTEEIKTGFYKDEQGNTLYKDSSGQLVKGWLDLESKRYFFNTTGIMETGWVKDSGKWYYLAASGEMLTGWVKDSGKWYYLATNGEMLTGWVEQKGKRYYLKSDGAMVIGELTISGINYQFDSEGALKSPFIKYTTYDYSLDHMIRKQLEANAQTDKYRSKDSFVFADYITVDENTLGQGVVNTANLNVRETPSSANGVHIYDKLEIGTVVTIKDTLTNESNEKWYKISYNYTNPITKKQQEDRWRSAKYEDIKEFADPTRFAADDYQFLLLSGSANTTSTELNSKVLQGKGILEGRGQAFIDASKKYNINEVYLLSHALLETGNGTSNLSKGIKVTEVDGKPVESKIVYNMYGIQAVDSSAEKSGSEYAYKQGWFTPEEAIIGGAKFIAEKYINKGQDTLYKMRWNPANPGKYPQYATDIGWAYKQTQSTSMRNIYSLIDSYSLYFDVPIFK